MDLDTYKLQPTYRGQGRIRTLVATLFGLILLNPPMLEIFSSNRESTLFGWPVLLVYIFVVWMCLILLVVWPRSSKYTNRIPSDGVTDTSNK